RVDLGEGLQAQVRVSEIVPFPGWSGLHADVELPAGQTPEAALQAAVAEARRPAPTGSPQRAQAPALPDAVFRPDAAYAGMAEPDLTHRQLAVIRAWNVIHFFYPYLHLIGDWDAVLPEYLARMETAGTGRDYALTVAEMMARVADGHTRVVHPEVNRYYGEVGLPLQVRWIEGAPVVTAVRDDAHRLGIEVGDALLAVDGEPVAAAIERLGRYVAASTRPALLARICPMLLRGPDGSTATLSLQGLDGTTREVKLKRDRRTYYYVPPPAGDTVRILPGNLGYADLTRLTPPEVDGMFERLRDTRAIIFDMRGYPNGTAWPIAPRIHTRDTRNAATFRRALVSAFNEEEAEGAFAFSQPVPKDPRGLPRYTRPTVMLIDERAISQSEHSGLLFEAANGTRFIGTATAGANGDVTNFTLPGGITVAFTGHDVRHADGRQLQRVGLTPHVEAAPTRKGLREGKDEVLERAVRFLEEELGGEGR
ncbi:MAG TPA: S41 family peptidase, partial [Thermoanaerobaculia bacterium]|nr:S41 family peptidase [Thermoanaerobaculia bacterium]